MMFDRQTESGHIAVKLMAHTFVERDIAAYGPIERSDADLKARARHHVTSLPTPQAVLGNDIDASIGIIEQIYSTIYKGLLVGYTSLKEPYRLSVEPRYTTSVNLDDSEDEYEFVGLLGLLAIIKDAQDIRRKNAQEDGVDPEEYLLTVVRVTVYDTQGDSLEVSRHCVCYNLEGNTITGVYAQTDLSDDTLRGLGLPLMETFVSAKIESEV